MKTSELLDFLFWIKTNCSLSIVDAYELKSTGELFYDELDLLTYYLRIKP